jgi:erythromycin esterase
MAEWTEVDCGWTVDASSPAAARGSFAGHPDLWTDAQVVGLGWTARTIHELHVVTHGLVRYLVAERGFRSVLVEGDREMSRVLDAFVVEGTGDPRRRLAGARPFLASEEMLDLVLWLREVNETGATGSGGPVRLVHGGADDLSSPAALERGLAEDVLAWQERHPSKLVYVGGAAHLAVAAQRSYDLPVMQGPSEPGAAAGAHLRARLGRGYRAVGLTFGSGSIPQAVPAPAAGSAEAALDRLPRPTTALPATDVAALLATSGSPDRLRIVGPHYDPADDPHHAMVGDVAAWFDLVIHQRTATPVSFLSG